jgi:hypothetical protein
MGITFRPTASDFGGAWEGVLVTECWDLDIVVLTADRDLASRALAAYCTDMGMDRELLPPLESRWVIFERQPEGAESLWAMKAATEGDEQALRIHHVPA